MKQIPILTIVFVLFSTNGWAQATRPNQTVSEFRQFSDIADEIKFYLLEAGYSKREGCLVGYDQDQLDRLRTMAKENKELFLATATSELRNASAEKTKHLVRVLIQAGSEDNRPLLSLFSAQSLKDTFSENSYAITFALNDHIKLDYYSPQSFYVLETLAAIKYYSAIPDIVRMLNKDANQDLEKTMTVLIDLNASKEIAEFVQAKIFEELCNKNGYRVVDGTELNKVLEAVRKLSKVEDASYSKRFQQISEQLIFEPNEETLIKFADGAKNERLRATAILLLAVSKTNLGLKVIIQHLKTDPSTLVRMWAAQSFVTHPKLGEAAVDALIETYHTDKERDVRWASIEALGKIGREKGMSVVKEALTDQDAMVREMAQRIIEWIENQK